MRQRSAQFEVEPVLLNAVWMGQEGLRPLRHLFGTRSVEDDELDCFLNVSHCHGAKRSIDPGKFEKPYNRVNLNPLGIEVTQKSFHSEQ